MPKLKSSKSASKRILKLTSRGKYLRRAMSTQHLASGKSRRSKESSKKVYAVSSAGRKKIKKLLPYL